MSSIKQKIYKIIADQALMDVSEIKDNDTMESLGIDSLGVTEAVFIIEDEYDIEIPFNANQGDTDPQEMLNLVTMEQMTKRIEAIIKEKK